MEILINEVTVVLRDKMPAKESWGLMQQASKMGDKGIDELPFDEVVEILRRFILSWGFEGMPQEVTAYAELDLFNEFMPLMNACFARFQGDASKN